MVKAFSTLKVMIVFFIPPIMLPLNLVSKISSLVTRKSRLFCLIILPFYSLFLSVKGLATYAAKCLGLIYKEIRDNKKLKDFSNKDIFQKIGN